MYFRRGFGIGSWLLGVFSLVVCVAFVMVGLIVAIVIPPIGVGLLIIAVVATIGGIAHVRHQGKRNRENLKCSKCHGTHLSMVTTNHGNLMVRCDTCGNSEVIYG